MKKNKLILIGAGGHSLSVLDSIDRNYFEDIVIVDSDEKVGQNILDVPVVGTDRDLPVFFEKGYKQAFISIGSTGNSLKRQNLFILLKKYGFSLPVIADQTAILSSDVNISEGTFIGKGAIINTGVNIGSCCIINTGTIIDHECKIGQFSHIATGVSLSGGICIGKNVHIGTGSSVIHSIAIGDDTVIGAGSVVVSDIKAGVVAYGNPCRVRYENEVL